MGPLACVRVMVERAKLSLLGLGDDWQFGVCLYVIRDLLVTDGDCRGSPCQRELGSWPVHLSRVVGQENRTAPPNLQPPAPLKPGPVGPSSRGLVARQPEPRLVNV